MDIEVGEYIRTKFGKILKIDGPRDMGYIEEGNPYFRQQIIKHNKNIIDLIKVGDWVTVEDGGIIITGKVEFVMTPLKIFIDGEEYLQDEIRSIVTKEQFKNIEYKVGD